MQQIQPTPENPLGLRLPLANELSYYGAPAVMIQWAGNKTCAEFIASCDKPGWLLWIAERKAGQTGFPSLKQLKRLMVYTYLLSYAATVFIGKKLGGMVAASLLKRYIKGH